LALISTVFVQAIAEAASAQRQAVANQLRIAQDVPPDGSARRLEFIKQRKT